MSESPKQIVLLSNALIPRGSTLQTIHLANELGKHGYSAELVCESTQGLQRLPQQPLKVRAYPYLTTPVLKYLQYELISRDYRDQKPFLVHAQSRHVLKPAVFLARRWKLPVVLTVHDYLRENERLKIPLDICPHVIAVSDSVKQDLVRRTNLTPSHVTVIHSGIVEPPHLLEHTVLQPAHTPVIGMAGPLEHIKGVAFFLAAAQALLATGRKAEFLIAGSGPEEAKLRELARWLGIEKHVTYFPNLSEFHSSIMAMDIFCLPSLQQGLGTIMLEAMIRQRPVIATNVGGVHSIVKHRESGLLIPPADHQALTNAMIELLDNPMTARTYAERGCNFVRAHFQLETMVRRTVRVYNEVIESTTAKTPATK